MNINNKPTVNETAKSNFIFLSHENTLRKITVSELEEAILVSEEISQVEIDSLYNGGAS